MKTSFILLVSLLLLTGCNNSRETAAIQKPGYYSRLAQGVRDAKEISQKAKEQAAAANEVLDDQAPAAAKKYYPVLKIIDGDTIEVEIDGTAEKVRLLGINTPEVVDPRKPVECFGREASAKAHELLDGREVELEADATQADRDKYNRLLRYLRTKEGLFYNLEIIKLGYAYEYTYDLPYKYQAQFKAAQTEAQNKKIGLWADGACGLKNK